MWSFANVFHFHTSIWHVTDCLLSTTRKNIRLKETINNCFLASWVIFQNNFQSIGCSYRCNADEGCKLQSIYESKQLLSIRDCFKPIISAISMRNIVFSKPALRSWISCVRHAHHHCNLPDSTTLKYLRKSNTGSIGQIWILKCPLWWPMKSAVVYNGVERLWY